MFRFEIYLFTFCSDKRNVLSEARRTGLLSTGFLGIKQGSRCLKAVQIATIIITFHGKQTKRISYIADALIARKDRWINIAK